VRDDDGDDDDDDGGGGGVPERSDALTLVPSLSRILFPYFEILVTLV